MAIRLHDIDLNLLVCLDALVKDCHVSRAAERVGVSQPTMSVALAKLREIFKDPLLVKKGTGLMPTTHALELHGQLQEVLGTVERMLQSTPNFVAATATESFSMIMTDYADLLLLPRLIPALEAEAPNVHIKVLGPNPKRLAEVLGSGAVDAVVTYFPDPPQHVRTRTLLSDRLVVIARKGHPAFQEPMTVGRFSELLHVHVAPGEAGMYGALVDDALARYNLKRRIRLTDPNFLAIPFIVASSDTVACVPRQIAVTLAKVANIEVHEPPLALPSYNVVLMWHERTHQLPAHEWFRRMIVRLCEDLGHGE